MSSTIEVEPAPVLTSRLADTRHTLALALPIYFGFIASMLSSFIGTLLVGNYGSLHLAAIAIGSSMVIPVSAATGGVLRAATPAMAEHFGRGQLAEIGPCMHRAMWLGAALCAIGVIAVCNASHLYEAMDVAPEVRPWVDGYLGGAVWGLPALTATTVLSNFTSALSWTRPLAVVGVMTLLANAVSSSVLIYGALGSAPLGSIGAGWGVAIGHWVGLMVLLAMSWRHRSCREAGAFSRPRAPDLRQIWALFRLGFPIGATVFVKFSIFTALALLMAALGTTVVAAHQVALNVAELAFMAPFSVGAAVVIQVGQALGRGEALRAQRLAYSGVHLALAIGAVMGLAIFLSSGALAALYTSDPRVALAAASVLPLVALQQLPETAQVSAGLALTGYKDTKVGFVAILIGYWCVCLPVGHVLGSTAIFGGPLGLTGYWLGLLLGLCVVAAVQVGRLIVVSGRAIARAPRSAYHSGSKAE